MQTKNLLLSLFCLVLVTQIDAQVTYQASDFLEVGAEFRLSTSPNVGDFDFAQTGENFAWDYTDLPINSQEDSEWIDSGDGGYEFAWCFTNGIFFGCAAEFEDLTNVAQRDFDGIELMGFSLSNVVTHYKKTDNTFEVRLNGSQIGVGGLTLPLITEYSDPDSVYQFPFTFGDTDFSTSEYTLDLNGFEVPFALNVQTQRTNTVEGYGSLVTPYGEFEEVLKMKTIIITENAISVDSNMVPTIDTTVEYKWFDKNYGIPVLTATGNLSVLGENILTVEYIDSLRCVEPQLLAFTSEQQIFANANTQEADVTFVNLSQNADSYLWDFGDGENSTQADPDHTYDCPGEYDVTLTATNSACDGSEEGSATLNISVVVQDTSDFQVFEIASGLQANIADAQYQWVDCNDDFADVEGANEQAFYPTETGEYALILTRSGCETVSDCYSVIISDVDDIVNENGIRVYPNPTTGDLFVDLEKINSALSLEVFDVTGKVILTQETQGGEVISLKLKIESGLYFLKIKDETGLVDVRKITRL